MQGPPERIKIGPLWWTVELREFDEPLWGESVFETKTIHLKAGADLDGLQSTLVHECIHALWSTYGWPVKGKLDEEAMVSLMESPLFMLIRDNPNLITWLNL